MSREARSFFTPVSKAETAGIKRGRSRIVDDEEETKMEPASKSKKVAVKHDSDLEEVDVSAYFGSKAKAEPKQAETRPRPTRTTPKREAKPIVFDLEDDMDIDDLDIPLPRSSSQPTKASPRKSKPALEIEDDSDLEIKEVRPSKVAKAVKSPAKASPRKKAAPAPPVSGPAATDILATIPDAELPEEEGAKKFNYRDHQANAGAEATEWISVDDAAENCLNGLTFVFTGKMPTLPRDQAQHLVKLYGGKVTSAPSGKTSCVVLGGEAGPKKIQKIKELGIKAISQDGFLQLLREMPKDGGSGEAAQKALDKKRKEDEAIEASAQRMAEQMAKEDKKALSRGAVVPEQGSEQPVNSARVITSEDKLWTSRYAPTSIDHICGNKGAINKLADWLSKWRQNARKGFKDGAFLSPNTFRAAIISGPPGIGKTTTAHLLATLQGYDVVETNASDARSKSLINSQVGRSLGNTSLKGFMNKPGETSDGVKKEICIIMDEVDGMSAGDRGGVGAMAALCKKTNVPIILICNERNLPKMRPFDKTTYDIKFIRPDVNAIRPRVMAIAKKEGLQLDAGVVDQLVQSTHSDIRQIINILSTFSTSSSVMDFESSKEVGKASQKHTVLKPFEIVAKYLSPSTFSPGNMSFNDKIELYFNDHDFAPLMVQENYLSTDPVKASPRGPSSLELMSKAAESISDGDLVDRMIHGSQQQWSLMPLHGALSCVRPSYYACGKVQSQLKFSSYLGNNSKAGKYLRLLQELQSHMRLKLWDNKLELRLSYLTLLTSKLLDPLVDSGADGVPDVISVMDDYYLTKEDWDVIMELAVGPKSVEAKAKALPSTVKSAFTRKYNSSDHPLPYMKSAGMAASESRAAPRGPAPDIEDVVDDDLEPVEEEPKVEEDEDISKNKYIKIPKAKGKAKAAPKTTKAKGKAKK